MMGEEVPGSESNRTERSSEPLGFRTKSKAHCLSSPLPPASLRGSIYSTPKPPNEDERENALEGH